MTWNDNKSELPIMTSLLFEIMTWNERLSEAPPGGALSIKEMNGRKYGT